MTHDEMLGFGTIREDDEYLDRLARREAMDDDLGGLFSAWTGGIDSDEAEAARRSGPWRLRGEAPVEPVTPVTPIAPPRTVRLHGPRAAAIATLLVATMSTGGVAAAMTLRDRDVSRELQAVKAQSESQSAQLAEATQAREAFGDSVEQVLSDEVRAGNTGLVQRVVSGLRTQLGPSPAPALEAQLDQIERTVASAASSTGVPPTAVPTRPGQTASGPAAPTSGPSATSSVAPGTPGSSSAPTDTSTQSGTSAPSSSPPATTSPTSGPTPSSGTTDGGSGSAPAPAPTQSEIPPRTEPPTQTAPSPSTGANGPPSSDPTARSQSVWAPTSQRGPEQTTSTDTSTQSAPTQAPTSDEAATTEAATTEAGTTAPRTTETGPGTS